MDCTQCGEANRDGARFCGECGAPLARHCANCNAELNPRLKFCDECGTPTASLTDTPPAASTSTAPTATRKTVTALFADLVGSTSFGERTDAEVARSVMARYHSLLQDAIDTHGGTVAKFMGDGMMATFGIPEIAEDDARRAVRAGLDIQGRFTAFAADVARQHGETLGLRVGVNTGEVVIASGDADLVGDALNVAARIEHACNPGRVTVGEETWRLTRGEFGYETLGEVTVAGRAQPVAIYEVLADTSAIVETATPFVGRGLEMDALRAAFASATETRSARLVTVLGSPGVGKTRLSRELCTATERTDDALTFEIRCDRAGDATFAPIAQLIRDATALGDDTATTTSADRLAALFDDREPDRDRLVDILGGLVGSAPARSVEETFWAVRRLVGATATVRPLVVVIDDIQWAEPLLLDLLEHLAEWVQDVPLLLLCLARPELRDVRPTLTERNKRVAEVIALDGLDSAATEQLAAGLLGTDRLPAGLVERLPASTDGNPLFVRELVRMLVDDQVIRRHGDEWELAIDADAVEVPPTIQSLLAARVERLPGDERAVLELASVIGAEFNLGALRELAGAHANLPTLLESMRRKELVEPTGTYWGDEPVHRFHHVLIRDAAYRRLLKTTRADLHERVAAWTDHAAEHLLGEHEAVIAFHYEQAHRYRRELGTVDEHVIGLGRRAATLLSTAADRALGRDDLAAAGTLSNRAVALLPESDTADRARLLLIACECTLSSGDVTAARPAVVQLRAAAGANPTLSAWAACFEAQLVGLTDPEGLVGAEATATGAATIMEELGDGAGEAKAHQVRAGLLARLGRVGDAELELDLALGAARRVDDRRRVTAVLGAAPLAALWGPSPVARAGGRCLDVVRLLRITTASPSVEATSMRCQAVLEALRGRFDVARSMLDSSRTTLEELGLRHGLLETSYLTGVVELVAGDPAASIAPLREAYEGLIEMGVGIDAGRVGALLAHALVAEVRIDDAEPFAAASEQLAGQDLKTAIAWRVARAEVLAAHGEVAAGIALANEAIEIAAATDLVIDHADACASLAALHAQAGDTLAARSARTEAKSLYDLKGATVPSERLSGPASHPTPEPPGAAAPRATPTATPIEHETRTPLAENDATTVLARAWDLTVLGRFDEIGRLCDDDAVVIDRQQIVGEDLVGRDAIVANSRAVAALGVTAARVEPLAVRGSRLALARTTVSFGSFENAFLSVAEVDAEGLGRCIVTFDEDALDDAIDELAARHLAGEGAGSGAGLVAAERVISAANRRAWDECLDLYSTDVRHIDHRQIGLPVLDREGLVATLREYCELVPDLVLCPRSVIAHGDTYVTTADVFGSTADGSTVEWVQHAVGVLDADGRISELEMYDEEDFPAALARFDELSAAAPAQNRHPRAENTATRVTVRYCDAWSPDRFAELLPEFIASEVVRVDHRSVVAAPEATGHAAFSESVRSLVAVGYTTTAFEPIAVRGERLCLGVNTYRTAEGFATAQLALVEIDDLGRMTFIGNYDESDLVTAVADLEARFAAGEGAPAASILQTASQVVALANGRDWDETTARLADDFAFVDTRQIGWPETDRAGYVALQQSYADEIRLHSTVRTVHVRGRVLLSVMVAVGRDAEGGAFEWPFVTVATFAADDRIARIEMYDEADFPTALARLDELGSAPTEMRGEQLENTATRTGERVTALMNEDRFEDLAALFAPEFVNDDRRTTVSWGTHGREMFLTGLRASSEVGFRSVLEAVIAIRGDRLVLRRLVQRTDAGDESAGLMVGVVDTAGRFQALVTIDDGQIPDAIAELDARYLGGEGAADAALLRPSMDHIAAFNRRDWAALLATMQPDIMIGDHRGLWPPESDRDAYLARMQRLAETTPDSIVISRRFLVAGNASLATYRAQGTSEHGSRDDYDFHVVARVVDGRFPGFEFFADDDFAAARARLDELSTAPVAPAVENRVTRLNAAWVEARNAGHSEELEHLIAPGYTVVSHRFGGIVPASEGVDEMRALSSAGDDVGFTTQSMVPVAVRGDRLALTRLTATTADGLISERLEVTETDPQGRFARTEIFEVDALAAAVEQLDRWYAEGEGAAHAAAVTVLADGYAAMNRRDLDAWAAIHSPGHRSVDHSPIGFGELGTQRYAEYLRAGFEQIPDLVIVPATLEVDGRVALLSIPVRDTTEGPAFESDLVVVTRVDNHLRIVEDHFFAPEQWVEARALFETLAASGRRSTPELRNTVTDTIAAYAAQCAAGEFGGEAFGAEDMVRYDRRRGVSTPTLHGRAEFESNMRAIFEVFDAFTVEPVAIRGVRVALVRVHLAREGFATTMLGVYETDEHGRITRGTSFDEENFAQAMEELDERFIAGEGAAHEYTIRRVGDVRRGAFATDRPAAYRALHTPDCTVTDHRLLSWPTETVSDIVDQIRADRGISAPRTTVFSSLEILGDTALITQDDRFVTPEGSEYLKRSLVVTHFVAGLADSIDYFEPEQYDAARARFEELGARTRSPHVDNAVVRLLARGGWMERHDPAHDHAADFAEDISFEDQRSGVSLPPMEGVDPVVVNIAAVNEVFGPTDFEPVAMRGDHLALVSTRTTSQSGFELTSLMTFETDDAGRICHMVSFDDDDLLTALTELDSRYLAITAVPAVEASLLVGVDALNRQDWDRFTAMLHPDFVAVDHSPIGFADTDRDGFVDDQMRGMTQLVPDFVVVARKVLTRGRVCLMVGTTLGTTAEGNEYRWDFLQVTLAAADGRALRRELFAEEQWTQALDRFDELATEANRPLLENRAIAAGRRAMDGFTRGDRAATLDAFAPEFTRSDRRRGPNIGDTVDREQYVDATLAGADVGMAHFEMTPIELAGDDHALTATRWHNGDGFELEWLLVTEVDADGRILRITNFDINERSMASALLHLWAAERGVVEGAPANALTRTIETFPAFFAEGDFDGMAEVYGDPGMIVDDRRTGVSAGVVTGRDEVMDRLVRGLSDVGFRTVTSVPIAVRGEGLALFHRVWHDADGLDLPMLVLLEAAPSGRVGYQIMWSVEDVAAAVAELDRRAAEPALTNGLMERSGVRGDALDRGDRDAVLATYVPDFVREDRRRGVNFDLEDRAAASALLHHWAAERGEHSEPRPDNLATRRLAEYPDRFFAGDWDWIADLLRDDVVNDDRRTGVSAGLVVGRDAVLALTRGLSEVGFTSMTNDPIAVRGERVVLVRRVWHHPDGFEVALLALMEIDTAGQMISNIMWDGDEFDAAMAELDRRAGDA